MPTFDLYLGPDPWSTIAIIEFDRDVAVIEEIIHVLSELRPSCSMLIFAGPSINMLIEHDYGLSVTIVHLLSASSFGHLIFLLSKHFLQSYQHKFPVPVSVKTHTYVTGKFTFK